MKKFLKNWLINALGLSVVGWLFPGFKISYQPSDFLLTSLLLTIVIKLIKPLFEVVFLPLNLLTLGVFRWIRTVISLGLVVSLAPGVSLARFSFPGLKLGALEINSFETSSFISLIIAAFLFNLAKKIIHWLIKTK
jgi:putative membrane protein